MNKRSHTGLFLDMDERPKKGGWAPGNYLNKCSKCDREFIGDKRAWDCAHCAYDDDKGKDYEA